jgi:ABC-type uncharacterized transport system permease subunit
MLLLFIGSALLYGAAVYAYGTERERDESDGDEGRGGIGRYARLLLAAAALLHFLAIGAQCLHGDHPLKNIFLATSFATWFAVVGYLPLSRGGRLDALGSVMAPIGLVGLALGVVFSGVDPDPTLPMDSGVASAHVGFASAGLAGFTLAAGVAGLYLVVERRLRNKIFKPGRKGMSLTGLDKLHHRLVLLVTPIFTLAIVTGVLWIVELGGPHQLSGRVFEIVAAAIAWIASVSLLVARATWGTRGRKAAQLTLLSFAAIILIVISYGVRG